MSPDDAARRGSFLEIEQSQASRLDALRSSETDAGMLSKLVEMSCLLELSKLSTARLDLAGFAQACVGVLSQFVPVVGVTLTVALDDLPAVRVSSGEIAEVLALDDDDLQHFPLLLDGARIGELSTTSVPDLFGGASLFEKAAAQVVDALPLVIEGEYRRREAAVGRALQLAATVPDHYGEDELDELAATMASLPSAIGCAIRLEAEDGGTVPLAVRSGATAGGQTTTRSFLLDGHVELEVSLWWGAEPHAEEEGFERVLAVLVSSLDRIERNRRLMAEAETDPLTGVGNRRLASRALASAMGRAERHGEHVSVMLLDLDKFKHVNDTLGHGIGDEVLATFARMLATCMRTYDTVARVGGEEFFVICPDLDGLGAETVARRLIEATPLACAQVLPEGWVQTVSLGIATFPDAANSGDRLMRRADDALYAAKRAGRNRFAVAGQERPHRLR